MALLNDKSDLNKLKIATAWARITVKVWREKIVKLKVIDSNKLWQSFTADVIGQAGDDDLKIQFAFEFYGKFVDMGVGKGTPIGGVKENAISRRLEGKFLGNRRRPKKWYSKTLAAEVSRLAELLADEMTMSIAKDISTSITES
jgi:hypothetical protein